MTPVAVRTGPSGVISGWDMDTGEWIPYRHMLLSLTKHADITGEEEANTAEGGGREEVPRAWAPDLEEQRAITAQFIKPMLYSLRREQVLLMTHLQNSRNLWPALMNGNLRQDTLQFGASAAQGIGLYGNGLRHVRIRDHTMDETPSGTPPPKRRLPSPRRRTTSASPAVFGSALMPGPIAARSSALHRRRAQQKRSRRRIQLRRAPDYRDTLALPLQMHLAKLAEEYVLPHDTQETER
jgi:hypothetical protein